MSSIRDGYVVRWRGQEYEASPCGDEVHIYASIPSEGFTRARTGRFVRVLPLNQVEEFCYVRTVCSWRGEPFIVLAAHEEWLRVEYTGGKAPVAKQLGLEEFDFGVYQGWVPKAEVVELAERRV